MLCFPHLPVCLCSRPCFIFPRQKAERHHAVWGTCWCQAAPHVFLSPFWPESCWGAYCDLPKLRGPPVHRAPSCVVGVGTVLMLMWPLGTCLMRDELQALSGIRKVLGYGSWVCCGPASLAPCIWATPTSTLWLCLCPCRLRPGPALSGWAVGLCGLGRPQAASLAVHPTVSGGIEAAGASLLYGGLSQGVGL